VVYLDGEAQVETNKRK